MGQIFTVYNSDKNEYIENDYAIMGGSKLTEHSYVNNALAVLLRYKLANDWKGDSVYHLGEFAGPDDGTVTESKLWDDADNIINDATPVQIEQVDNIFPIIINHSKKQYIDVRDATINRYRKDKDGTKIPVRFDPLLLLTACGNELSSGGYNGVNQDLLGSWAGDSLEASNEIPENYEKFEPVFKE